MVETNMASAHKQQDLDQIFSEIYEAYTKTKRSYEKAGYEKKYPLGGHWIVNLKELIIMIQDEVDPIKKIASIQETVMYSLNTSDEVIKGKMIDWYFEYFNTRGIDIDQFDTSIQESVYSNPNNSARKRERLISPDFLRTIIICLDLQKYCQFPEKRFNVLELGAGFGGLARTFKLFYPNTCSVIVDLPETLYFSYIFIRLNFPDLKIFFLSDSSSIEPFFEDYDFIFVPTMFAESFQGRDFTLFYNTASLGEMKNPVIRYWMDFVENKINVKYFFGLNRFLNTIDPDKGQWRLEENCCSVSFDSNWDILQWELDPPFARCPYIETLCSRNLEIIAQRCSNHRAQQENISESQKLIEQIKEQDWFTRPRVVNKRVEFQSDHWPLFQTRADNNLTPDLSMNGTLYALWRSINLQPNSENIKMMIQYLHILGRKWPFEELFFYQDLLNSITGEKNSFKQISNKTSIQSVLLKLLKFLLPSRLKQWIKRIYNHNCPI